MAVGDVISGMSSIAAAASLTYQPSAGTEVLITAVGGNGAGSAPDVYMEVQAGLTDGSLTNYFTLGGNSKDNLGAVKLFLNNTNYLVLRNGNASTQALFYSGIQTK
jgi:hypothetical protein